MDSIGAKSSLIRVIEGGYCIGCGGCAALDPTIRMEFDEMQRLQAFLPLGEVNAAAAKACPFADGNPDENWLSQELFNAPDIMVDTRIGRHLGTFGGWVEEGNFRVCSSSGGIGSWMQAELLEKGLVDAVINVTEVEAGPSGMPLFRFTVARTLQEVIANAKTRYYPVEMSGVVSHIRDNPGRFAVIGVPCFAKAFRLIARQDSVVAERLRFVLAIVCGHLKSAAFAEAIAWQCGIRPEELSGIDFRTKLEGRPASRYGVTVKGVRNGGALTITRPMEELLGSNWGHGLFKLKACEFCDDVFGETADAVVGDAWLPAYDGDHRGANVVVVRNPDMLALLCAGAKEGRLCLDSLTADELAASQAGGLRQRRDGLAYRLWLADRAGDWRPKKRVAARRNHLDPHMQRIYRLRYSLGQESHAMYYSARQGGCFQEFLESIMPLIQNYECQMNPSLLRRALNWIWRKAVGVVTRLRKA